MDKRKEGIVVGCDQQMEWALPWWWEHYSAHNFHPVAFVNFGMSKSAAAWCRKRGQLINLPKREAMKKCGDPKWVEKSPENIWSCRDAWFQKPIAALHSPFPFAIWLDLDCQVRGNLYPLFDCLYRGVDIALVRDEKGTGYLQPEENHYNSGVIAFRREATILKQWANLATEIAEQFPSDEEILSRAISLNKPRLFELQPIFNWFIHFPPNPDALIIHFIGPVGKLRMLNSLERKLTKQGIEQQI